MTDIDAIPAGSEMDRLVAEQVMKYDTMGSGETPCTIISGLAKPYRQHSQDELMKLALDMGVGRLSDVRMRSFNPSTDIADAWEVLERVTETIGAIQVAKGLRMWQACRAEDGDWDACDWYSLAETAHLAICRAALKARKVKLPNRVSEDGILPTITASAEAYNRALDKCVDAIRAAGIEVAP